jgi:hypothetical protein
VAYKSSARGSRPVIWVAGHTAEGARTARSLASYFYRDDIMASSHTCIDAKEILQIVPYDRAAWTLRGGNPISDNAELCGFAGWTRAQWLSTGTVDGCVNPRQMIRNFARWAKARCVARKIPIRKLSVAQVKAGNAGIIHHKDYTEATRDGTHWDMGYNFPWDVFMEDLEDDMALSDDDVNKIVLRVLRYKNTDVVGTAGPDVYGLLTSTYQNAAEAEFGSDVDIVNQQHIYATKADLSALAGRVETMDAKLEEVLNLLRPQQ